MKTDTALDLIGLARQHRITLSFEGPPTPILVTVEPVLLEEVLRTLIDNAIRYNRAEGEVRVTVSVEADRDGGRQARIGVEDDGPGIPQDQHAHVFERFYRLERPGDPGGNGLGLAIVRAFAQRLGAEVSLRAGAAGRGLLVEISLPCEVGGS